jgi:ABC-type Na+ efflux pump permease subunit
MLAVARVVVVLAALGPERRGSSCDYRLDFDRAEKESTFNNLAPFADFTAYQGVPLVGMRQKFRSV